MMMFGEYQLTAVAMLMSLAIPVAVWTENINAGGDDIFPGQI